MNAIPTIEGIKIPDSDDLSYMEYLDEFAELPGRASYGLLLFKADPMAFRMGKADWLSERSIFTLDMAEEAFRDFPSAESAARLLETAEGYANDDMIGEAELADIRELVSAFLSADTDSTHVR